MYLLKLIAWTYSLDDGEHNFDEFDDGPDDPDVEDGEEGKDDGPEQGEGQHEDGGDQAVEPQLGLAEQDEGQSPQGVEPVRRGGLGQHVREVELKYGRR